MNAPATRRIVLPPLLKPQQQILASTESKLLFRAGVGGGKTHALSLMALRGACDQPGFDSAILATSFTLLKRVTLPTIFRVVPSDLYTWHAADHVIEWVTGAITYCLGVDRTPTERIIGMNLAWAGWDEAGASRDGSIIGLISQRLRVGDPKKRFVALFTSPHGHGWLEQWASRGVRTIHSTTYDNPYLDADYLRILEEEYPPGTQIHRQELLGEYVSQAGRVYGDVFSRTSHTSLKGHAQGRPWRLTVDPGFRASAWLAWQLIDGAWTVVKEWLPEGETTEDSARRVKREMGGGDHRPESILMDTPSKQNSRVGLNDYDAIKSVFGSSVSVRVLGGHQRSSDWRHRSVIAGLQSGALRIYSGLCPLRIGKDERGLVHALETCEWPKPSTRNEKQDEQDPRKHVLDALEFGAAVWTPPRVARSEDRARYHQPA